MSEPLSFYAYLSLFFLFHSCYFLDLLTFALHFHLPFLAFHSSHPYRSVISVSLSPSFYLLPFIHFRSLCYSKFYITSCLFSSLLLSSSVIHYSLLCPLHCFFNFVFSFFSLVHSKYFYFSFMPFNYFSFFLPSSKINPSLLSFLQFFPFLCCLCSLHCLSFFFFFSPFSSLLQIFLSLRPAGCLASPLPLYFRYFGSGSLVLHLPPAWVSPLPAGASGPATVGRQSTKFTIFLDNLLLQRSSDMTAAVLPPQTVLLRAQSCLVPATPTRLLLPTGISYFQIDSFSLFLLLWSLPNLLCVPCNLIS